MYCTGMHTLLLMSGVTSTEKLEKSELQPEYVTTKLADLLPALEVLLAEQDASAAADEEPPKKRAKQDDN